MEAVFDVAYTVVYTEAVCMKNVINQYYLSRLNSKNSLNGMMDDRYLNIVIIFDIAELSFGNV